MGLDARAGSINMIKDLFGSIGPGAWLTDFDRDEPTTVIDGLVRVGTYDPQGRPPEEVATMEKALSYGAHSVFFEAGRNGRAPIAQAFVYVSKDGADDEEFANLHKRLWSWGGVPLLYRKCQGQVQLFRCAHDPDFISEDGTPTCNPIRILDLGSRIAARESWWDAAQIRNGTLWDNPSACRLLLSARRSAHRKLVEVVKSLYSELTTKRVLTKQLRRRLLILSFMIAYLEEREVLEPQFFSRFLPGASRFFQVLRDGDALVAMLHSLEGKFNGNIFSLTEDETAALRQSKQLDRFAQLVEGHEEPDGQLTFWRLYSFKDLPVELLSQIYQIFVQNSETSVYTPPKLVRLMLEETLSWDRLDNIVSSDSLILDPACGSGVFLVETYRRLVLHWRSKNGWARPTVSDLNCLLSRVYGVDLEEAAIELAAFSLCLSLCDALKREDIRSSENLFPKLPGWSLHHTCFFAAKERVLISRPIGAVVGNPPFKSGLTTPAAKRCYIRYVEQNGALADKQLAYLFLHEAMTIIGAGGVLSMVQPAGFLYNRHAEAFRKTFFRNWRVREILDFVSVRGMFKKGAADPKVVVVIATSEEPDASTRLLHAVFRRSGRAVGEQVFDIDYYDLHWIDWSNDSMGSDVWRANLLGGDRMRSFLRRIRGYRTIGEYARSRGWDAGEGYIQGQKGISKPAEHLVEKPLLPTAALSSEGIEEFRISRVPKQAIKDPKSVSRFTPPLLLVKEHENLYHGIWKQHYLAYKNEIVGFAAPENELDELRRIQQWLNENNTALQAYLAGISIRLFTQRATSIASADILALPYPKEGSLDLSENEEILAEDVVCFMREFVRRGNDAAVMRLDASDQLNSFNEVFVAQINAVYQETPVVPLEPCLWPGIICQPFSFGEGRVEWGGADELRGKLDVLLRENRGESLTVTRIARIYDGNFVFLLKPDRLRYWLRSIALRDADDVRADLRLQGF